jgi:hypothetical protein
MFHDVPTRRAASRALGAAMLIAAACTAPQQRAPESASSQSSGTPMDEQARLAQLERDARALAKTTGCAAPSECRTAPVGWRGCGGPRTYLVYCAASTDSIALFRKLDELKAAETAYNKKSGMMSTCEMRLPPTVTAQGGRCSEAR